MTPNPHDLVKRYMGSDAYDPNGTLEYVILEKLNQSISGLSTQELLNNLDTNAIVEDILSKLKDSQVVVMRDGRYHILTQEDEGLSFPSGKEIDQPVTTSSPNADAVQRRSEVGRRSKPDLDKILDVTPKMGQRRNDESSDTGKSAADDLDFDSLLDDALGESMTDFMADFPEISIEQTKEEGGIIKPLVEMLIEYNYLSEGQDPEKSDEYKLMQVVLENYPISSDDIETKLETDSMSLMLSNLKADDLIQQTNDYRYAITKKVAKKLQDYIDSASHQEVDSELLKFREMVLNEESEFIKACFELNYLTDKEDDKNNYNKVPEYEVLNLVRLREPIDSETVKNMVNHTLPVVVSRMLSKLHADGVVDIDMNNKYHVTAKLFYWMVKERLPQEYNEDELESLKARFG